MTVEEIFSQLGQHMIQGLMVHTQLADYFYFLGLKGYGKCHEYHYFDESYNYRELSNYYMERFNKFITQSHVPNPQVIPDTWYKYTRQQVDASTRKTAIQAGFEKWVEWEQETKILYENMYEELIGLNEVAAAMEVKCFIIDVDKELSKACQKHLELKTIDFNISNIFEEQEELYCKYKEKIECRD